MLLALALSACASPLDLEGRAATEELVRAVARAHGVERLRDERALTARVRYAFAEVEYGARLWVDGKSSRSRLELDGGALLVHDGEGVWCAPAEPGLPNPAFHAVLAARLARLPAELLELLESSSPPRRGEPVRVDGQELATLRVRRAPGSDALADELVVHVDPRSGRIALVGLVARLADGGSASSAVRPEDWVELEGYLLATTWRGARWSPTLGLMSGSIAALTLDEPAFVRARPELFARPRDARRLPAR